MKTIILNTKTGIMICKTILCAAMLILYSAAATASEIKNDDGGKNQLRYYRTYSQSMALLSYRDFATSPLYYHGIGIGSLSGRLWERDNWELAARLGFTTGLTFSSSPVSDYFSSFSSSVLVNTCIYTHYLHRINSLSFEGLDFMLGGAYVSDYNIRTNLDLNNNGLGIENISNIMLAVKAKIDASRKEAYTVDLHIYKYTFKPMRRIVSYQANIGLLNMNYRPGYAYSEIDEFQGTDTNPISFLLSGHQWSINGWRLSTSIDFAFFRENGNGFSLGYVWDAAHAPGKYEAFQMASHRIQYTRFINRK